MRDLSQLATLPESWHADAANWRASPFRWTRWERPHPEWTHDHCNFCQACICDHRERFPHELEAHRDRGCYRYAYHNQLDPGCYLWVCRTCFQLVAAPFRWTVSG